MNGMTTGSWRLYEAGRSYNRRIGLYETVRKNERFYRGDQWYGAGDDGLPHPVFNVVRRITDYLVSSLSAGRVSFTYTTGEVAGASGDRRLEEVREHALGVLGDVAENLFCGSHMERELSGLLMDAALTGDAVAYCRWDPQASGTGGFRGEVETVTLDGTNLFVADVSTPRLQSQDWVMLAGRDSVGHLQSEAQAAGLSPELVRAILPDGDTEARCGDLADSIPEDGNATFLVRFWREDGQVVFQKSTRTVDFPAVRTTLRRYPVALFNWYPTRDSYHGTAPVTGLVPNQRFINLSYALCMKHLRDTAFSKVVYDQSRIPEWTNEVGEAIAAVGGGNIADAAAVIGVGRMQEGYLEFLERVTEKTKEMMGATDTVLGSEEASNTSAILALQEASRVSFGQVTSGYCRFLEDLAEIWADIVTSAYPPERPVPGRDRQAEYADFSVLAGLSVHALAEIAGCGRYSASETLNVLDNLLSGGHITAAQYLERLPDGLLAGKESLIAELKGGAEVRHGG